MQSGRKVKRKTTLKNKNLSKDKVPKSLEKKVSKSTRNHHVELKGKKAQKRNRGKSIEITADTKADVKKTAEIEDKINTSGFSIEIIEA